jgi:hypothetical protein
MRKTALALLMSAFLVASCASGNKGAYEKAPLFGMIYDEDNQACPGVILALDGAVSSLESGTVSDIRGRFVLPDVTRGEHVLVARKDGYEELSLKVTILNRTDVLSLKMISFGQLLGLAEKALEERKWEQAHAYLGRAAKLDPADSVLSYLKAVQAYSTASYQEAADLLNGILEKGTGEPSVYLFLADIYERKLADREKAIENLQAYLRRRADSDAEKRLVELKAER